MFGRESLHTQNKIIRKVLALKQRFVENRWKYHIVRLCSHRESIENKYQETKATQWKFWLAWVHSYDFLAFTIRKISVEIGVMFCGIVFMCWMWPHRWYFLRCSICWYFGIWRMKTIESVHHRFQQLLLELKHWHRPFHWLWEIRKWKQLLITSNWSLHGVNIIYQMKYSISGRYDLIWVIFFRWRKLHPSLRGNWTQAWIGDSRTFQYISGDLHCRLCANSHATHRVHRF